MGCCGEREKFGNASEQRWDYLNLSDFKSTSCWTGFSYGLLYFFLIISFAVYLVDIYTASNLLFFNRWSSQVKPAIPFEISKWVFAGCIILSWILLAYRWWRALRAMKSGIITASYLDPLAVRIECVRIGQGQGWRRFLVFTALTKGRKGSEYVALFTYFSFEAWLRILFAEGPRQVINALTLYSVLQAELIPVGDHKPSDGHTPFAQFFVNIGILADSSKQQATILFGMLYVLVVWLFTAISLFIAFLMYITFLWHHIPTADGSLSKFCQRKIEKRLNQIVRARVDKAIANEHLDRVKNVATGAAGASVGMPGQQMDIKRQPTIPVLTADAEVPTAPMPRQSTTSLESRPSSPFGSRPASPFVDRPASPRPGFAKSTLSKEPIVPGIARNSSRPEPPSRNTTQSSMHSNSSYASNAPLIGAAAAMGHRPYGRRPPPGGPPRTGREQSMGRTGGPPPRSYSNTSQSTQRSASPSHPRKGPPLCLNRSMSGRSMTPGLHDPGRPQMSRDPAPAVPTPSPRRPPGTNFSRRPTQEYEMHPPTPTGKITTPHSWERGDSSALPRPIPSSRNPNITCGALPVDYFAEQHIPRRAGTAPVPQSVGYDDSIFDAYGARDPSPPRHFPPPRSATVGPEPRPGGGNRRYSNGGRGPLNPPRF